MFVSCGSHRCDENLYRLEREERRDDDEISLRPFFLDRMIFIFSLMA